MASALDHERTVLAAIFPARNDLLEIASRDLTDEHFTDLNHRMLFQLALNYMNQFGGILPGSAISDILSSRAEASRVLLLEELYAVLSVREVDDSYFHHSVSQLMELKTFSDTESALVRGMEVLRTGVLDPKGELIKGSDAARAEVAEQFAVIDRGIGALSAPEGDMRLEYMDMTTDFVARIQRARAGVSDGIGLGIPEIDSVLDGGLQPGELTMLAGYSSDGKSTMCVNAAWHASVVQHRNVVVFTTETVRVQYRRKLIARHSMLPKFNIRNGLNSRDLKAGTLSQTQIESLGSVLRDFRDGDYGRLYIAQVPRGATIASCEQRLYAIQRKFHRSGASVDVVYFDYLALLSASARRLSDRESLASIIKEAKQVATSFDGGRGVPFVTPWQMNRTAKDYADMNGYYTTQHLAETAEATNSSDVILSILAKGDEDARVRDVFLQVLKNRDGETVRSTPIQVRVDYGTSTFGAFAAAADGLEVASRGLEGLGVV